MYTHVCHQEIKTEGNEIKSNLFLCPQSSFTSHRCTCTEAPAAQTRVPRAKRLCWNLSSEKGCRGTAHDSVQDGGRPGAAVLEPDGHSWAWWAQLSPSWENSAHPSLSSPLRTQWKQPHPGLIRKACALKGPLRLVILPSKNKAFLCFWIWSIGWMTLGRSILDRDRLGRVCNICIRSHNTATKGKIGLQKDNMPHCIIQFFVPVPPRTPFRAWSM